MLEEGGVVPDLVFDLDDAWNWLVTWMVVGYFQVMIFCF